jgi:protein involved in polysaccharide export with SLBB domain
MLGGLLLPLSLAAQATARPTPAQAQALLEARPDLVEQLRQRMLSSGLTPDQVRGRLKAEGYPETLLDAYLPGATTTGTVTPTDDVLNAVRSLGITDSTDVEALRTMMNKRAGTPRQLPTPRAVVADTAPTQIFGLSVFRSVTSEFLPNADGPVDAGYRIGPGDRLVLILTGEVEVAYTLDVTREGFVVIPAVGQLSVSRLTMAQLESLLFARLSRVYSGVRRGADAPTRFSVSVARLRSNQIFVIGDAMAPGSFRVSSAGTVLTALYAAGGPSDRGSLRNVQVRRGGKTVATLDVYDYLLRGDASNDVRLENGDVVFVPVRGAQVTIGGEITRPAIYELKDGETLADLVSAAGGFNATAGRQRISIERILPPAQRKGGAERVVVDVSGDQLAAGAVPALRLETGDRVRVFPVDLRVRSRVSVLGHVWVPGIQGFRSGMTLSQALRAAGGTKPDAYLGQVLVTRLAADSTRRQLRATLRDTTGAVIGTDLVLQDDDEVQVFSRTEFRPLRTVAIAGAVRRPGQFPYREGMTMRDLVLLAGGLEERASVREAEIARLPETVQGGITATTVRVPLDSSYFFDQNAVGSGNDTPLRAYDNVLILPQPEWQRLRTVSISGEVRFPGKYTIATTGERIDDLIRRAGGLTRNANADGAFYARRVILASYGNRTTPGEKVRVDSLSRVGVDVAAALKDARNRDNLLLEEGDSLDIPPHHGTVEVRGAVNAPTVVALREGAALEHYIRAAGGGSRVALVGAAYVQQPNGKIESRSRVLWLFRDDPKPRAGAVVFVPVRDTTEAKGASLQTFSIIAQLLATILTAIAVAKK